MTTVWLWYLAVVHRFPVLRKFIEPIVGPRVSRAIWRAGAWLTAARQGSNAAIDGVIRFTQQQWLLGVLLLLLQDIDHHLRQRLPQFTCNILPTSLQPIWNTSTTLLQHRNNHLRQKVSQLVYNISTATDTQQRIAILCQVNENHK